MKVTIERAAFERLTEYSPKIRSGVRPQQASSGKKLNCAFIGKKFQTQEVKNLFFSRKNALELNIAQVTC